MRVLAACGLRFWLLESRLGDRLAAGFLRRLLFEALKPARVSGPFLAFAVLGEPLLYKNDDKLCRNRLLNRLSAFLPKDNPHYRPIWGITR